MRIRFTKRGKKIVRNITLSIISASVLVVTCGLIPVIINKIKQQDQKIDLFLSSIQDSKQNDIFNLLDNMHDLNSKWTIGTRVNEAEKRLIDILKPEIDKRYSKFDHSEKAYRSLFDLTEKIRFTADSHKSGPLRKSHLYAFSKDYALLMDKASSGDCLLKIQRIEVRSTYDRGACIGVCTCKVRERSFVLVQEAETDSHRFISSWTNLPGFIPPVESTCLPWNTVFLSMYVWAFENRLGGLGETRDKKGEKTVSFIPGKYPKGVSNELNVTGGVRMKVYFSLNYKTLEELYFSHFN